MASKSPIKPWSAIYAVFSGNTPGANRWVAAAHNFLQGAAELNRIRCCLIRDYRIEPGEDAVPFEPAPYSQIDLLYLRAQDSPMLSREHFHRIVSEAMPVDWGGVIYIRRLPKKDEASLPDVWS